jgi:hypothetical protein
MSKSLAQSNKSQDVGKATNKHSALRDAAGRKGPNSTSIRSANLPRPVNGWGFFRPWLRRANVWRKQTNPARTAKRRRSAKRALAVSRVRAWASVSGWPDNLRYILRQGKMALIALWLFFAILVGMFAHHRRNRDGVAWFLAAVVFSPLAAFLVVAVLRESDGVSRGPAWLVGSRETRPWSSWKRRGTWPSGAPRDY